MREILFRGKRLDNGEWEYGDFLHKYNFGNENGIVDVETGIVETVDIDTVGQFTGLCGKNNVRIFEGDIVRNCKDGRKYKIVFLTDLGKYSFEDCDGFRLCGFERIFNYYVEVIGNIYDNPELLEDN